MNGKVKISLSLKAVLVGIAFFLLEFIFVYYGQIMFTKYNNLALREFYWTANMDNGVKGRKGEKNP